MTQLDVITGFLGAGKTTFITKYTQWLNRQNVRYCVIENEFGRAGVDGALLSASGVRVREIAGGCVCCTLKVTLHDLLEELSAEVDRIILEPSGLFCGDDLLDILDSPRLADKIQPGMWIGIVDPLAVPLMNTEDLSVLQSELIHAGSLAISKRSVAGSEAVDKCLIALSGLLPAPLPPVFTEEWDVVDDDLFFPQLTGCGTVIRAHQRRNFDHISMVQSMGLTIRTPQTVQRVAEKLSELNRGCYGNILRIKGVVPSTDGGQLLINATPSCNWILPSPGTSLNVLNIIGRELDRGRIKSVFEG